MDTMIITEKIDWISATIPFGVELRETLSFGEKMGWRNVKSPIPIYRECVQNGELGHKILYGNERIGNHVIFSGSVLQNFRFNEITIPQIYYALRGLGAKISRIDLAVDIFDSEISVEDFVDRVEQAETTLKGHKFIATKDGVETLYFGAMNSQRRKLRIYNKGIEQKIERRWTRIEYEKRRNANNTARAVFENCETVSSLIKSVLDFPNWKMYQDIIKAEKATIPREKQDSTDKTDYQNLMLWIEKSVAPAVAHAVILEAKLNDNFSLDKSQTINNLSEQIERHLRKELASEFYKISQGGNSLR